MGFDSITREDPCFDLYCKNTLMFVMMGLLMAKIHKNVAIKWVWPNIETHLKNTFDYCPRLHIAMKYYVHKHRYKYITYLVVDL